ncbi:Uu.00g051540.m01.CDS01 [Anthostomella pinea]|uniref:Uu.00g051540.m01.CDS01 n=1 Tax=Anthostomella pinea TaxID=933095 RepID=A0AAI8VST6_9PEZI|nr:Uu.00g051540.m01.CDS01 [Anthostomella pinea]
MAYRVTSTCEIPNQGLVEAQLASVHQQNRLRNLRQERHTISEEVIETLDHHWGRVPDNWGNTLAELNRSTAKDDYLTIWESVL